MLNIATKTTSRPFKHEIEGGFVMLERLENSDFDFEYQSLVIAKTGYFDRNDMIASLSVMEDKAAKGRKLVEFNRGEQDAKREAFLKTCVLEVVIDGEHLPGEAIIEELSQPCHTVTLDQWFNISSSYVFFLAKSEQEAEEQIKK